VRVLEVAGGIPAAFATHLLAGFGADVVRVEGQAEGPALTDAEEVYLWRASVASTATSTCARSHWPRTS
jgi:crotonobetainyl-CoA:carnitine CoA-transferase CaiB-like acyl-CoA transferase